ncbi:MAG: NAD-dependent epimerase/dehydratase family protein [Bacteroidetes bacterium]|nr:NAD-dependent epimerase/dehydratase family protein [Bacteroidota bacterium]MCW5894171.1 NAD-dependent epimerase/dehydratase family protein [Bacteroidota bacterium]
MPVKVLVTGGTGFVGSHLVDLLLQKNYSIRCLIRKTSDTKWLKDKPIEFVYGDLFDENALREAVSGVDYIYHSAGVTKAKTKEEYYRGNATGTRNLLEATLKHNPKLKRFVQISSQAAVGPSETRTPITEDRPANPLTTYGKSKWQAEEVCHSMMDKLPITIVRPPVVYGERDKDVFEFFNTYKKGLQPMVGFSEKLVSMIHVVDLVRGIVMAGESGKSVGQTYFITSTHQHGWEEIGEATRNVMNKGALRIRLPEFVVYIIAAFAEFFSLFNSKPALINFEKAKDMVQDYWTCDPSKAKRDFGFEQEISLQEGIRRTVEWYVEMKWL